MIFNLNSFTQKGGGESNLILLMSIVFIIIFFIIIMPNIETTYNNETTEILDKLVNIPSVKIDTKKCSRSCCINSGWPLPPDVLEKDIDPVELKKYVPNNFSCTDGPSNKSGCLCVTQKDLDYLTNKAGNIRQ